MPTPIGIAASEVWNSSAELRAGALDSFIKTIQPMRNEFMKSKAGMVAMDILQNQHFPLLKKNTQMLVDNYSKLPEAQRPAVGVVHQEAANMTKKAIFGSNNDIGAALIHAAQKEKGHLYAQNLADHMAMVLRDNDFKRSVRNNKELPYKGLSTKDVYTGHHVVENFLQNYNATILAPAIAIPHLSNFMNMALTTPLASLAKGMAQVLTPSSYEKSKQVLLQTGILADMSLHAYGDRLAFRNGVISKVASTMTTDEKARSVGFILNKLVHAPGFNAVREWTLVAAGSVGKINAEEMAMKLYQEGDKRSAVELKEMGINAQEVLAQKGQLSPAQLENAIYRYTDNKVFLDNQLSRSFYSGASPLMRMANMFHGFVTREGQLLRSEFMKSMVKSKDPAQIAQFMLVAGVMFPAIGQGVEMLERLGRGQNVDPKNPFGSVTDYADSYAHMAGFGIWASYARSATRMHLINTIGGPTLNVGGQAVQDLAVPAYKEAVEGKKGNWKPLQRDILEDTLPDNLGKFLAHQYIPTPAEVKEREPQRYKKPKREGFNKNAWKHLGE